jgi:ADP-ribose pyrophosphatase YjhB (NUDIX family)
MIDINTVKHKIQIKIIDYLVFHEIARFTELRPKGVDTNLCTYHLGKLVSRGLVDKQIKGYSLTLAGMAVAENRKQVVLSGLANTKITLLFLVQNSDGDVLLERLTKQPFMNNWTLPFGRIDGEDASMLHAARREFKQKFNTEAAQIVHAGICYIRVNDEQGAQLTTLAHVFSHNSDDISQTETLSWARPHRLDLYRLAPGTESVIARCFFNDPFFFEEFDEAWSTPVMRN